MSNSCPPAHTTVSRLGCTCTQGRPFTWSQQTLTTSTSRGPNAILWRRHICTALLTGLTGDEQYCPSRPQGNVLAPASTMEHLSLPHKQHNSHGSGASVPVLMLCLYEEAYRGSQRRPRPASSGPARSTVSRVRYARHEPKRKPSHELQCTYVPSHRLRRTLPTASTWLAMRRTIQPALCLTLAVPGKQYTDHGQCIHCRKRKGITDRRRIKTHTSTRYVKYIRLQQPGAGRSQRGAPEPGHYRPCQRLKRPLLYEGTAGINMRCGVPRAMGLQHMAGPHPAATDRAGLRRGTRCWHQ